VNGGPAAVLVLEDGSVFGGTAFGAPGEGFGEAVFNTGMSGYQEVITDPSYAGQVVAMTAPQQGNYGTNAEDAESGRVHVSGFVVREVARRASNWRATGSLADELARAGVVGLEGVDTRRLTLHLRDRGAMRCGVSTVDLDADSLLERVRSYPAMEGSDLAMGVSSDEPYAARDLVGSASAEFRHVYRVAAYDFGLKRNLLRRLAVAGIEATVVPATTPAAEVRSGGFDGVFLSNGPGDPAATTYGIDACRELLGTVPVFGICLGHQLLCRAVGLETFKLRFGHRGANHPVKDLGTGRIEITAQNHGFAVVGPGGEQRLDTDAAVRWETDFGAAELSHINLYDRTVEGLVLHDVPAACVQYHPEAGPGPHDSLYLFDRFIEMVA
jgi:carbamoyl-phosphate synthase small subunit